MTTELDRFADLQSVIHSWDPRLRIVGLFALALSFTQIEGMLLPLAVLASVSVFALSRLPLSYLAERLRMPGLFFGMLAVLMPFIYGSDILVGLGPLGGVRKQGLELLLGASCRFLSIMVLGITAFGTSKISETISALRWLGIPAILADMLLFTYRFIHETGRELAAMRTAVRLRGFSLARRRGAGLGVISALMGSLLVRGWERSEEVLRAMRLRAYSPGGGGRMERRPEPADVIGLLLCLAAAVLALLATGHWG